MEGSLFSSLDKSLRRRVAAPLRGACRGMLSRKTPSLVEALHGLSPNLLKIYQLQRIKILVSHAYVNVPFYREAWIRKGLHPREVTTFEHFHRLPVLTVSGTGDFAGEGGRPGKAGRAAGWCGLGGSPPPHDQGEPMRASQLWFFRKWFRWEPRDRVAFLSGVPMAAPRSDSLARRLIRLLGDNELHLFSPVRDKADLDAQIEKIIRFAPDIIRGKPSAVMDLAGRILERRARVRPPKSVVLDAWPGLKESRKMIESAFRAEVFAVQGLVHGGYLACECRSHSGFHINGMGLYVEFLCNGRAAGAGRPSRIVFTDLHSLNPLLIRCMTGHVGMLVRTRCSCGSSLPLMRVFGKQGAGAVILR